MQHEILLPGAFAMLKVHLEAGETIKAESDAMLSMTSNIKLESKMEGGLFGGLKRSILGGESMFFQTLTAEGAAGQVILAPAIPGDLVAHQLNGHDLMIQTGGFLAAEPGVNIDTKMQSLGKGFFSGAGLFVVKASGVGTIFLNAFGALYTVELPAGEESIVDNGHIVAWDSSVSYTMQKAAPGLWTSMTSGEMLVCKFTGPGKIYLQSRNPGSFGAWMSRLLPAQG